MSDASTAEHSALVAELRIVRERGLLHLRGVPLDVLRRYATRCGLGDDPAGIGPVENLVRGAVERLGGGRIGEAAQYTFGLAPGTRDWPAQDRRRRAAQAYAVSVERFRKHHERVILDQVAEQALALAQPATPAPAQPRSGEAAPPEPPPHDGHVIDSHSDAMVLGLPRDTAYFTGRSDALDATVSALRSRTLPSQPPVICVIDGMAGVGKTALAVRVARQVGDKFPDGCLFLDLRGYTTGAPPVPATEALDRLLRRLGVAGNQIPRHVDDRAALYRDRLSGRRLLILLDNARDAAHVRPLLPAAPGCAALITSRDRLVALDEAQTASLDPLAQDDAAALFRSIVGSQRIRPDDQAVIEQVVDLCGRLPLAIRVAAARHRANRRQTLTDLINRLADKHAVLAELDDGDRSVAASFAVSYSDLPDPQRRMFAVLALHPGGDFDAYAAAALSGQPVPQTVRALDHLVERHLLTLHTRDRYRFHDLIGAFAAQHAVPELAGPDRTAALHRLVDYYLCVAEQADTAITPHRYRIPLDITHRPSAAPYVGDHSHALAWLTTEEPNIVGACRAATGLFDTSCWQMAFTLRGYFFLTKRWDPWLSTHELALAAARRVGDRRAEAMTLNNVGLAAIEQGQHDVAATHYQDALELFRQVGDAHGEHTALANLAWVYFYQGDHAAFLRDSQPALAFYRRSGAHRNAAITLRGIALAEVELGRLTEAIDHLHEALDTFRQLDLRLDATMTLNGLGEAYHHAGDSRRAAEFHHRALEASQDVGSDFEHARADHRLGQLAADAQDYDRAHEHWNRALRLYQILGAPQVADVRDRLASLPRETPQQ